MPPLTPLKEFRPVDAGKVMGNYFAARGMADQRGRQVAAEGRNAMRFETEQRQAENVFADRERKLVQDEEDRGYKTRKQNIEQNKEAMTKFKDSLSLLDTSKDDAAFNEDGMKLLDGIGNWMNGLGYSSKDIQMMQKDIVGSGALSKAAVKRLQMTDKPKTSTSYADLEAILGRKPTMKEVKEFRVKKGKTGDSEDAISRKYAMEYAYKYGGATTPQEATSIADQLQGKTVAELEAVKEDKGYWSTLWGAIRGGSPEEGASQTAATATRDTGTVLPRTSTGNEPVPQTQEDFAALPPGTVYRDPDDGQLYTK